MGNKIAAIWARVSTSDQTSLPDQIARAKEVLEDKGYTVPPDRILKVDWTSLELFDCPEFQRLYSWVKNKEIGAIAMLDRDRLQSEPEQRLTFLAECRQAGVELILCQGPPLLDNDMGRLLEHVYAISKKQQVMRARTGAKDGLHDKVVRDNRPISKHRLFGYRWETDTRLVPADGWDTLKLILDMGLAGKTFYDIQRELKKRAIPGPRGNELWYRSTIRLILRQSIYAGRYYALRQYAVRPVNRKSQTYGNTSSRQVPLERAIYLPQVEVVNPPISWAQFERLQERSRRNKELALRNARRDYLLRGLVFCDSHLGKKGEPRRYYGEPKNDRYVYSCPVGGCKHPNLNGPRLEADAKDVVTKILNAEGDKFYQYIGGKNRTATTKESLQRELKALNAKEHRNLNADTELENRNLVGQEHPEVYRRLKARFQGERVWIEDRRAAIEGELAQLNREVEAIASLQQIRADFKDRLDRLTDAEWRELFITLNLRIHITDLSIKPTWWGQEPKKEKRHPLNAGTPLYISDVRKSISIWFGVPLTRVEQVANIVTREPSHPHSPFPS